MGSYLSAPVTTKETETGVTGKYPWAVSSMQGWRTSMEDSHIVGAELNCSTDSCRPYLFSVFDGHGGAEVARFCSKKLPSTVEAELKSGASVSSAFVSSYHKMDDFLRENNTGAELRELRNSAGDSDEEGTSEGRVAPKKRAVNFLQESIQGDLSIARERGNLTRDEAQQVMMKMMFLRRLESTSAGVGKSTGSGASSEEAESSAADNVGCTAVSALVYPPPLSRVYVANAGDSRCMMSRKGVVVELSFDHKPNHDTERDRIQAAGGYVEEINNNGCSRVHHRVNGNLNLSRAVGDLEYKKRTDLKPEQQIICSTPDVMDQSITPDDEFLVLACDGVWDIMSNQECVDFVRKRILDAVPLSSIVEQVFDHCIADDPKETQGLGGDNMTCIIVQLKPTSEFD